MSDAAGGKRFANLPALDGLRGLALAGVLAFHADGALVGGYLGVDLFFVLSGYLITSLLLAEHAATGRIDLAAFWARRAKRLLPALFALVPAIVIYASVFARPEDVGRIRDDTLGTLFYFANWRAIWSGKSYWDLFAAPSPLEHTWSLAIEEQFYLVWPLLAWLALRAGRRRAFGLMTAALLATSMALSLALYRPENVSRVYYGTDTRATAILFGAGFALVARPGQSFSRAATRVIDVLGLLALGVLAFAWATLDGADPRLYRGGFWVTELAGVALVGCALAGRDSWVARGLSLAPLRALGAVSYGAYLWHWPVNVTLTEARTHLHGVSLQCLRVAVSLTIAAVSYHLLERPIRHHGLPGRRPVLAALGASALVVLLSIAGMRPRPALLTLRELPPAATGQRVRLHVTMVGDSTADSLGWALRGVRDPEVVVDLKGHDGFNLLGHETPPWPDGPTHTTIVELGGAFLYGIRVDGKWTKSCHPEWDARFEKSLTTWLAGRKPQNGRVRVATVPYPLGPYDTETYRGEVDCINRSIRKVAAAMEGIEVLELGEILCPGGACTRTSPEGELRPDGVHYDLEGARAFARAVLAALEHS